MRKWVSLVLFDTQSVGQVGLPRSLISGSFFWPALLTGWFAGLQASPHL